MAGARTYQRLFEKFGRAANELLGTNLLELYLTRSQGAIPLLKFQPVRNLTPDRSVVLRVVRVYLVIPTAVASDIWIEVC
jgi:hypothetical protein